jgi:O-antigen/teichoic acid export membrane protein
MSETAAPGGLARVVLRGAGVAGAGYAVTQAISLASYLVLARLLQPADLGTFAAATIPLTIGLVLGESGLLGALIQRHDRVEEAFDSAFVASLAAGVALTIVAIAAAPLLGLFFDSSRVAAVAAVMAGSMFIRMALITPNARLARSFSFARRSVVDPLGTLAFAVGAVGGAAAGLGPWALVIGTYAQLVLDAPLAWGLAHWRPRPRLATVSMWRELARFGRPVFIGNLIRNATIQVPVVLVGRVLGSAALGQFSYAFRVASQPLAAVIDVGAYALLPAFARIAPDPARFRAGVLRGLRWTSAIAFPLGLLLIPLGTPAVVLVFGARWRTAGEATAALGVYCAALTLDSIASEVWKAAARPGLLPRMHGLSLALSLIFVAAFLPLGVVGVTIGMAVSAVGVGIYAVHGISEVVAIPLGRLVRELWAPACASCVMAAVLFVAEHGFVHSDQHGVAAGVTILALEAIAGAGIYVACLSILAPALRRELLGILSRGRGRKRAARSEALGSPAAGSAR